MPDLWNNSSVNSPKIIRTRSEIDTRNLYFSSIKSAAFTFSPQSHKEILKLIIIILYNLLIQNTNEVYQS